MDHPGREKFITYICERAIDGKEDELRELLINGFHMHDDDPPLAVEPFHEIRSKLLSMVKGKYIEEIVTNMSHFCFTEEMK